VVANSESEHQAGLSSEADHCVQTLVTKCRVDPTTNGWGLGESGQDKKLDKSLFWWIFYF